MESTAENISITIANAADRENIYTLRHDVYAKELNQHKVNDEYKLKDDLDNYNLYIIAKLNNEIVGFISLTPPASPKFSVDKYFDRSVIPFVFDDQLYEIRLLTVLSSYRHSFVAIVLMYAAMRWVEAHGGENIIAICRNEYLKMYMNVGITPMKHSIKSGSVTYQLAIATIKTLKEDVKQKYETFNSIKQKINWKLPFNYFAPFNCYHGGSFFKAIGEDLKQLDRKENVINADVLDAWFPPSPKVTRALTEHLPWLLQTSPPTYCEGMTKALAAARGVKENCILPGAGSSSLIFLGLQYFLNKESKVLILDPCYGEYVHVLENIIQCNVVRFKLDRSGGFVVDAELLLNEIQKGYDMVVIVNPNSPTGVYVYKERMEEMLSQIPPSTLVWIDETYIEYVGKQFSLEQFAVKSEHVIICKSMSKVYALSGARLAYLCCSPHLIETLKSITPPWSIGLPSQLAAITALNDDEYYEEKYRETNTLRDQLRDDLQQLGIEEIIDGVANFLLFYLPDNVPSAKFVIQKCKQQNLFLRDVTNMGSALGDGALRIAVKDKETNKKMIAILRNILEESSSIIHSTAQVVNTTMMV